MNIKLGTLQKAWYTPNFIWIFIKTMHRAEKNINRWNQDVMKHWQESGQTQITRDQRKELEEIVWGVVTKIAKQLQLGGFKKETLNEMMIRLQGAAIELEYSKLMSQWEENPEDTEIWIQNNKQELKEKIHEYQKVRNQEFKRVSKTENMSKDSLIESLITGMFGNNGYLDKVELCIDLIDWKLKIQNLKKAGLWDEQEEKIARNEIEMRIESIRKSLSDGIGSPRVNDPRQRRRGIWGIQQMEVELLSLWAKKGLETGDWSALTEKEIESSGALAIIDRLFAVTLTLNVNQENLEITQEHERLIEKEHFKMEEIKNELLRSPMSEQGMVQGALGMVHIIRSGVIGLQTKRDNNKEISLKKMKDAVEKELSFQRKKFGVKK